MNFSLPKRYLCVTLPLCAVSFSVLTVSGSAQTAPQSAATDVISLVHDETPAIDPVEHKEINGALQGAPKNFHQFSAVRAGEHVQAERLTFQFSAATKLTKLHTTKDFIVESDSGCVEGRTFDKGDTCTLYVRFEPKGAGRRLGKLTIEDSASPKPESFGLGGYGYAPVISFTPSIISTVNGTYPSSSGLLSGAMNLAVDGNDTLYMADTGNGLVRSMDSSGTIVSLASGYTGVSGVAADSFGQVYFDLPSTNVMYEIFGYGPVVEASGTGTASCPASSPCTLESEALNSPGEMSINSSNQLFFADGHNGAALSATQPTPASLIYLYDPFPYQVNPTAATAVDQSDNLYSLWATSGDCELVQQTLYDAENSIVSFNKIAGGRTCGFSGDGGQAGNAEIGGSIGQIAFDIAGNLYFSDTTNQRVRRIDYTTGQINTIAGNGTRGYSGDGGAATTATLNSPTGVGVDSQGQVYIISSAASGQIVRKVGTTGHLNLGSVVVGASSPTQTVTLANTGNSNLDFTRVAFSLGNTTDFSTDPNATTCNYAEPLAAGKGCKIGFIFKPTTTGARSAVLTITDDTVNGVNTIQLAGTGATAPAAKLSVSSLSFPSTTTGSSKTLSFAITNSGSGTLTVSAISNSGANPSDFTHTSNCGGNPLAAGASCTVQVTFAPAAAGTFSATMSITDNASNSPQTLALSGTGTTAGVKPKVSLSAKINPAKRGESLEFSSKVASKGAKAPTGTVQLKEGSEVLAEKKLTSGAASLKLSTLSKGNHTLIAYYSGDASNQPAESATLKQIVK